jgi:hypothetical protein
MPIEIQTFRLAPGATESAFLEADARLQTEFIYQRPGLVRRTTARGPDGEWLVIVLWGWEEAADDAARESASDPVALAYSRLVEDVQVRRYTALD